MSDTKPPDMSPEWSVLIKGAVIIKNPPLNEMLEPQQVLAVRTGEDVSFSFLTSKRHLAVWCVNEQTALGLLKALRYLLGEEV